MRWLSRSGCLCLAALPNSKPPGLPAGSSAHSHAIRPNRRAVSTESQDRMIGAPWSSRNGRGAPWWETSIRNPGTCFRISSLCPVKRPRPRRSVFPASQLQFHRDPSLPFAWPTWPNRPKSSRNRTQARSNGNDLAWVSTRMFLSVGPPPRILTSRTVHGSPLPSVAGPRRQPGGDSAVPIMSRLFQFPNLLPAPQPVTAAKRNERPGDHCRSKVLGCLETTGEHPSGSLASRSESD
jgi:hypothetical protein